MRKIFEYIYTFNFNRTGSVYVCEDGSLYTYYMPLRMLTGNEDTSDFGDKLIFKEPEMVDKIKEVIKNSEPVLSKLPTNFTNPGILDGAHEKVRFGKWKFEGNNIIHCDAVSDKTFNTIELEDFLFRGTFYSSEIQKVFEAVKTVIDSFNKTGICLWFFDEPPEFPNIAAFIMN